MRREQARGEQGRGEQGRKARDLRILDALKVRMERFPAPSSLPGVRVHYSGRVVGRRPVDHMRALSHVPRPRALFHILIQNSLFLSPLFFLRTLERL